jgi:hypothetical protein
MKISYITWSIFLLINVLISPALSQQCERGNSAKSTYLFRPNDDRCEGTRSRPVAGGLSLAGLYIGQLQDTPQLLPRQ